MNRLANKRALITGGTTGIGLETARPFLREGARVAVTGKNPRTLDAARQALGPNAAVFDSDAGNVSDQKKLASQIRNTFSSLDVLFPANRKRHPYQSWMRRLLRFEPSRLSFRPQVLAAI